jgi:uncharacterized protein YeaO (DUF488 family)
MIRTDKNVYDKPEPSDGERILVMRLWPRGISKDRVDRWVKELGTDVDLIHDWKQGRISWDDFAKRYVKSLKGKEPLLKELAAESKAKTITLLCTDKDEARCHRSLLKREVERYL